MDAALQDLVRAGRAGDTRAFEALVLRFQRHVAAYVASLACPPDLVDELTQETFVRAWFSLASLQDPAKFHAWLVGIARHVHMEWARDRKKQAAPPAPVGPEPSELLERRENLNREIHRIVGELPSPYGEVLTLRYYSGRSPKEIASFLGRTEDAVRKQISRGCAMVAQKLQGLHGFTTVLDFFLRGKET
jgi:RNA polymerase sigma-70 factor, ECF subfamily